MFLSAIRYLAFLALLWAILFLDFEAIANYLKKFNQKKFVGDEFWLNEERELCDDPTVDITFMYNDSYCYLKIIKFEEVRIEILSWVPPLVVYRDIFTANQVENYLQVIRKQELQMQEVVDDKGKISISEQRQANGSYTDVADFPEARSLEQTAIRLIPNIDFKIAEPISALSYLPGGHYSTHYDYLSDEQEDDYHLSMGHRMATFIMVFQKASSGGGTVFPYLGVTVRANPGDAFLWMNMKKNMELEEYSYHGGCPVNEGRKVIATIWVRSFGQPLLDGVNSDESFNASALL